MIHSRSAHSNPPRRTTSTTSGHHQRTLEGAAPADRHGTQSPTSSAHGRVHPSPSTRGHGRVGVGGTSMPLREELGSLRSPSCSFLGGGQQGSSSTGIGDGLTRLPSPGDDGGSTCTCHRSSRSEGMSHPPPSCRAYGRGRDGDARCTLTLTLC